MKPDIELSDREQAILSAVVDLYVKTAEPVGSRAIAQKFTLGLSPATIRNTMQDLEEGGFLSQPHTSAGRIPTDLGYRYFVDRLLRPVPLTARESDTIRREVELDSAALSDILAQTSRVLSRLTNQLGVTVAPVFERGIVDRIELVHVARHRLLVILTVRSGLARTLLLEMESDPKGAHLEDTERLLNERLTGLTLGEVRRQAAERLRDARAEPRLLKMFVDATDKLTNHQEAEEIHLGGTSHLMTQPEFKDPSHFSEVLHMVEDTTPLREWIANTELGEGIVITIGRELKAMDLQLCAMVTASYRVGQVHGTIGVIGPTRMPYSKMVTVVDYTSRLLTEVLSRG